MTCPFLTSVSSSFLNRCSSSLLKTYVNYCPIASRAYSSHIETSSGMIFIKFIFILIFTYLFFLFFYIKKILEKNNQLESNDEKVCPFMETFKPTIRTINEDNVQEINAEKEFKSKGKN